MSDYDVVLIGEILVEFYCEGPPADGARIGLGFSGDVLNAAAAASAAGARTAILTAVADDQLGDALVDRVRALGVETALIRRVPGGNGAYLLHGDLSGEREFTYWRTGSAASRLGVADIERERAALTGTRALVASGVGSALSDSCRDAILAAARIAADAGAAVVYDPNFRARLTTAERARAALAELAPHCALITPSCPADARALLGTDDPVAAAGAVLALGARAAAVTCGAERVVVTGPDGPLTLPVPTVSGAVDATGAGDVLTGTTAARLALGDPLPTAVRLGIGAASLSVTGRGGTGRIPTLAETRAAAPAGRP
ncbi:PfkB family carbohydrate kinase [Streptomyces cheonanensis]|uniref:PfkB family carbohydrate kinase n=1 Tax=Streptomyces cheonanensis TaxID=312720 RepID=A0ABP5GHJ3_9ACTN|nr:MULTISPECIES: PfkB family carbohydrate kinase [Streptomyces]QKV67691.1 bifunctional hydroxymethylpyrimidine kinase/phosphomethylpyrimidine kinase [Streptomyces harbinensis]